MQTALEFAARCAGMPAVLREAQRRGVAKAALVVTTSIRDEIRAATGDMRLSGVGARGARIGARYDVKGTVNPVALIRATGPIQLIERDTRPHMITVRGRRRRSKKTALAFDGVYRRRVHHPGTRGKHPFEKGWKAAHDDAMRAFDAEIEAAVRRGLGV